jgi:ATP-dependent Clp protease ATP-binding subunit ClpA
VPYKLRDKEVYLLDLTALVAGTQFRGQFESRMKGLIEEIRSSATSFSSSTRSTASWARATRKAP